MLVCHLILFACQQLFYVDHVAVLTAYWLFRISLDRASLLIQVLMKWAPPPILIIVSFIGEICGTFDKLSVDRCLDFKSLFFFFHIFYCHFENKKVFTRLSVYSIYICKLLLIINYIYIFKQFYNYICKLLFIINKCHLYNNHLA